MPAKRPPTPVEAIRDAARAIGCQDSCSHALVRQNTFYDLPIPCIQETEVWVSLEEDGENSSTVVTLLNVSDMEFARTRGSIV